MQTKTLFIDDAGVLNSNQLRGPQWNTHIGRFMVDHLGGSARDWECANAIVASQVVSQKFRDQLRAASGLPVLTFALFEPAYAEAWLYGMCNIVGIQTPGKDELIRLHREAHIYANSQVKAEIGGAGEAIRKLSNTGFTIHLASNGASYENEMILQGMGIRTYIGTAYGTDIVNIMKEGPDFYKAIFAHAGVHPTDAVVIDDKCQMLSYAANLGAMTVCVGTDDCGEYKPDHRVPAIGQLDVGIVS